MIASSAISEQREADDAQLAEHLEVERVRLARLRPSRAGARATESRRCRPRRRRQPMPGELVERHVPVVAPRAQPGVVEPRAGVGCRRSRRHEGVVAALDAAGRVQRHARPPREDRHGDECAIAATLLGRSTARGHSLEPRGPAASAAAGPRPPRGTPAAARPPRRDPAPRPRRVVFSARGEQVRRRRRRAARPGRWSAPRRAGRRDRAARPGQEQVGHHADRHGAGGAAREGEVERDRRRAARPPRRAPAAGRLALVAGQVEAAARARPPRGCRARSSR